MNLNVSIRLLGDDGKAKSYGQQPVGRRRYIYAAIDAFGTFLMGKFMFMGKKVRSNNYPKRCEVENVIVSEIIYKIILKDDN